MNRDDAPSGRAVPIVGLGGSAGALAAILDFFRHLPADPGAAFVVILHLAPDRESQVPELIGRATDMPVTQVTEKVRLEPNRVYVIPPDHNLSTQDGHLCPLDRLPSGRNVAAIDIFFRGIAESHGPLATGIVFSGTGSDGAQGLRRIRELGGFSLVQSPEEAEFPAMPAAAVRGAGPDRVLSAPELGPELARLRAGAERLPALSAEEAEDIDRADPRGDVIGKILGTLYRRTGQDFSSYKHTTVGRRVRRRTQLAAVDSYDEYLALLRADAAEAEALRDDLLITVTSFFRDPEAFAALEDHVIPELLDGRGRGDEVRVWVPGCATGEEAYSLAILFLERLASMDSPPRLQIFATDASERAIQAARTGIYSEGIRTDLSAERMRHFDGEPSGRRVRKTLREPVLFAVHDLLRDPPFSRMDLIACRNLLIYLKRDVQDRVLATFHYALNPGGFLFLGSAESAETPGDLFEPVAKRHRVFRARPVAVAPPAARVLPPIPADAGTPQAALSAVARPTPFARHLDLLERLTPPSVVVDKRHAILHLSPGVGRFLRVRGGEPTGDLLAMVDEGLAGELRTLLHSAFREGRDAIAERVGVEVEGETKEIRLAVRPFLGEDAETEYAVVVFDELGTRPVDEGVAEGADAGKLARGEIERLTEQIRIMAAEHARTVGEFQAAYEELQSAHEEQRATGEELETSQEELQSVNEELRSVNQEYRSKLEELAEVNADLRNLIDSTDIATIFLDRELRIRRYTPPVTSLFNFVEADIGRALGDVTNRLQYPLLLEDAQRVLDSLDRQEREVSTEDGRRWFTVRLSAYRSQEDRIDGVVLTFHETTDRKRAELERERLFSDLQEANSARANFVGVMSHEFRTPLSSIIGYLDVIAGGLDGAVNPQQLEHLDRIRASAYQLNAMVEEILDYFRIGEGAARVTVSGFDVADIAREAMGIVVPGARAKGLELRTDVHPDLGEIRTDRVKLLHILTNLLGNALKFTEHGWISLAARSADGMVMFSVADSGIGIAADDQARIFERFWQAHTGTTRAYGGTGLGLTIVRDLARLLGGDVHVASEPGRGSKFTVSVPVA